MRRAWVPALVILLMSPCACRRSATPTQMGSEIANQRLHDHIIGKQRKVLVEHLGSDVIWSDTAILERASVFPPPIQELIDTRPGPADASVAADVMVQFLQDSDRRRAEWHPGTLRRKGTTDFECEIGDGKTAAIVNCVYANYLEARYPGAAWLYKAPLEPTLLYDGSRLRGALMPVKF